MDGAMPVRAIGRGVGYRLDVAHVKRSWRWCFGKICDGWNERRGGKANVQVIVFQLFSCLAWVSVSAGIRIRLARWAKDGSTEYSSRVARRLNGEMTDG